MGGMTTDTLIEQRDGLLGTGWGNTQTPGGTADFSKHPYFKMEGGQNQKCQITSGTICISCHKNEK